MRRFMMKKAVILLLIAGFAVPVFAQTKGKLQGTIREITGTVEIRRSENSGWTKAVAGMALDQHMSISTGFRSTAIIDLGGSAITVRPLTRIRVEELASSDNTENVALFIQAGRVRASVTPPPGSGKVDFRVRGPSATASVRGTEFDMSPGSVKMYSGAVAFAGSDGVPVIVNGAQSVTVGAGGLVTRADISSGLAPNLPLGMAAGGRSAAAGSASPEGSVTGRIGWYGQTP
jgi:hypothetical protein